MSNYTYINARVLPGIYAVLYRHGSGYAVTDYANSSTGITYEFETRSEAVSFRESMRKAH